jgi:hypothetical protein
MLVWCCCFVSLGLGLRILSPELHLIEGAFSLGREHARLQRVTSLLLELEETLASGLLPQPERWEELRRLPQPWGKLVSESVDQLRAQGGALLPTLKRLRTLAEEHSTSLKEARGRSAQALGQASACAALVPLFGCVLYFLLPGVSDRPYLWSVGAAVAFLFSLIAVAWMLGLSEVARWGGVPAQRRPWILAAQCAGERFLALVRCGNPADVAWSRTLETLSLDDPFLAQAWGHSIWAQGTEPKSHPATQSIVNVGQSVRKAVQLSLMEGYPCTERVETVLQSFRHELRAQMEREMGLLGTRCLVPLFCCVAPALLGLLAFGLYLAWIGFQ